MRTLNCKHTAGMISLFVAGDLEGPAASEVAAHLAACEGCRRIAEEFVESSSLLTQACAAPEFGTDFYSGIRHAVLGEIARDRQISKPWFFRRPWLYATACAVVVIAVLVVIQRFGSTGRQQRPESIASAPQVSGQPTSGPAKESNSSSSSPLSDSPQSDGPSAVPGRSPDQVRAFVNPRRKLRQLRAARNPDVSGIAQAALARRPAVAEFTTSATSSEPASAESPTAAGSAGSATSGLAVAAQVSRIEIQTADPNIRIIWLAPR